MKVLLRKICAAALSAAVMVQMMPGIGARVVNATVAESAAYAVPAADANSRVGAQVSYVRHDSLEAGVGGGATVATSYNVDRMNVASQASERSYIRLTGNGSYAEWKAKNAGRGVTMRYTMPDTGDGYGQNGSLDVYVNDSYVKTINLTSYYMWQYFAGGNPADSNDGGPGCFAFDEVHFTLNRKLNVGDKIRIQSTGANGLEYGVDFLEIEEVPEEIVRPDGSLSVTDFGAVPNDGNDDYNAIRNCINAANAQKKTVYFPTGTFNINQIWDLSASDIKITGAGMWHTNIQFTNSNRASGGISGNCHNVEFCNMYINSNLRSRYNQDAVYKCFMDIFGNGSVIHDVWEEHFECGFWLADYTGQGRYSDGLKIMNCRIRNNFADGVNFCQGTSNAAVYNCSIRNNGDDGLATWNNNFNGVKDETGIVFAYNTIDFIWRAGGIAVYGGNGFKIYNNYICDSFMSSGIHLNTTFDGYKFNNTTNIEFSNNTLVRAGSGKGSWGEEFGAIDIEGYVRNITFNNTKIYDSPHDAVRLTGNVSGITFNDTVIYGTGKDGQEYNYSSGYHKGVAVFAVDGASAVFNGVSMAAVAYPGINYINLSNITLNNVDNRGNAAYEVPGYPGAGGKSDADATTPPQQPTQDATQATSQSPQIQIPEGSMALDSSFSQSPLVRQWNNVEGSGYNYLGYAYMGGYRSAGYGYLLITYKGDGTAFDDLRWEFPSEKVYGLISTSYDGMLRTTTGAAINAPASQEQTVVIDLVASGIDVSGGIEGMHLHQTAGKGNFEITKAYLMKEIPKIDTGEQATTKKQEEAQTTSTPAATTEPPEKVCVEVGVNGFQISSRVEGIRTIYSLSNTENVVEAGLIYGLGRYAGEEDMVVGSGNNYVYRYNATPAGRLTASVDDRFNASYAMTMKFGNVSSSFFTADIMVRAYARLDDGTCVYSGVEKFTIYDVADVIYNGCKMSSREGHDYVYDKILKPVNPDYKQVDFIRSGGIVEG